MIFFCACVPCGQVNKTHVQAVEFLLFGNLLITNYWQLLKRSGPQICLDEMEFPRISSSVITQSAQFRNANSHLGSEFRVHVCTENRI